MAETSSDNDSIDSANGFQFPPHNSWKSRIKHFYLMWNGPSEPRDEPAPQIVSLEFLEYPR